MKASIWKDPATGRRCWHLTGRGLSSAGSRGEWRHALDAALDDMRWIESHRDAWR